MTFKFQLEESACNWYVVEIDENSRFDLWIFDFFKLYKVYLYTCTLFTWHLFIADHRPCMLGIILLDLINSHCDSSQNVLQILYMDAVLSFRNSILSKLSVNMGRIDLRFPIFQLYKYVSIMKIAHILRKILESTFWSFTRHMIWFLMTIAGER